MFLRRTWQLFLWRLNQIGIVWWITIGLVALLEVLWLWKIRKNKRFSDAVSASILIIYLIIILASTVLSREAIDEINWNQLVSFDISTAWTKGPGIYGAIDTVNELVLNILMFAPFGYLITKLARKRWAVFGSCLLLTLSIETMQLLTKRGFFELADILLNMIGALCGYIVCIAVDKTKKMNRQGKY